MTESRVRFGYRPAVWTASGGNPFDVQTALAETAEALGFDAVFFGDRMLASVGHSGQEIYASTHTELFMTLAAMAARTSRIHVGSLVLVVPFRHPVALAKQVASLDRLSHGRLILGVGAGWNPTEFAVLGLDRREASSRLVEGIECMRRLWTGEPVSFQGQHFRFEGIAVEPTPARPGGPPIWLGTFAPSDVDVWASDRITPRVDRALARAARLADGWVPLTYSTRAKRCLAPEMLARCWDRLRAHAASADRTTPIELVYSHWYYIVETREDEAAARRDLAAFFPGSFEEARETYLIGTPAGIAAKLRHLTHAVDRVDWYLFTALGPNADQLQRLRADVLPLLGTLDR